MKRVRLHCSYTNYCKALKSTKHRITLTTSSGDHTIQTICCSAIHLHSLTTPRLRRDWPLKIWQVVFIKMQYKCLTKPFCQTTQRRYTIEVLQSQNIAVFKRPNTIVSLCLDKNRKKYFFNLQTWFQCFWQSHAFHTKSNGSLLILLGNTNVHITEKHGCKMSTQWFKKIGNEMDKYKIFPQWNSRCSKHDSQEAENTTRQLNNYPLIN